MGDSTTQYRDLLPVIVMRERAVMPDGFDTWGIKSVRPDLRTHEGYQWTFPGSVAVATNPDPSNRDACPRRVSTGDGLCVAWSWRGMASGGIPARTLLLVAYRSAEVLGRDGAAGKLRTRSVAVVALVDGERLLREAGSGANLTCANLTRAYLTRAYLTYAVLTGADLTDADLTGANLTRAVLTGAVLTGADLTGADLTGANLTRANLTGAVLTGADLTYAIASTYTRWPAWFDAAAAGVVTL
jgi:hypothetical protein